MSTDGYSSLETNERKESKNWQTFVWFTLARLFILVFFAGCWRSWVNAKHFSMWCKRVPSSALHCLQRERQILLIEKKWDSKFPLPVKIWVISEGSWMEFRVTTSSWISKIRIMSFSFVVRMKFKREGFLDFFPNFWKKLEFTKERILTEKVEMRLAEIGAWKNANQFVNSENQLVFVLGILKRSKKVERVNHQRRILWQVVVFRRNKLEGF